MRSSSPVLGSPIPNSNFVSASRIPAPAPRRGRVPIQSRARRRSARARRAIAADRWLDHRVEVDVLVVLPASAFVAGVKIGSGRRSLSRRPAGSGGRTTARSPGTPSSPSRRGSRGRRLDRDPVGGRLTIIERPRRSGSSSVSTAGRCRPGGSGRCRGLGEPEARQPGQDAALVRDPRSAGPRRTR